MKFEELIKLSKINTLENGMLDLSSIDEVSNSTGQLYYTSIRMVTKNDPILFRKLSLNKVVQLFYHAGGAVTVYVIPPNKKYVEYTLGNEIENKGKFQIILEGPSVFSICLSDESKETVSVFGYNLLCNRIK